MLITLPYYANSERSHEARCSLIAQKLPWKTAEGLLREFKHIYFSKLLKASAFELSSDYKYIAFTLSYRFHFSKDEHIWQDFPCMNHAYLRFFFEHFHLIVIDCVVRHELIVAQINYVSQNSIEVFLKV